MFIAGLVSALAVTMKQHEAVLERGGRETTALVIATTERVTRHTRDTATVRYAVDGRRYEPHLPVVDSRNVLVGSEIRVVYDPGNPHHARPVEGWSPAYETVSFVALIILGFGIFDSARRTIPTLLVLRTVRHPRRTTTMRAESFSIRRWWQRWSRQWAALWPLEADPQSVDAQLYVPIEELRSRTALQTYSPCEVLGVPEPGRLLVITLGPDVVWPRGRSRRDHPAGAIDEVT